MKRNYFYNGYGEGGIRMIDIEAFSKAQKLVWAKNLLDTDYNGFWKILELDVLGKFNNDSSVLWKADAPDCVLNMLKNTQLAESLRVWYRYRDLIKENLGYGITIFRI